VKFSIPVDGREKHLVEFSWNQMTGALRIAVDGVTVAKKSIQFMSATNIGGPLNVPGAEKWNIGGLEVQLVDRWIFEVGGSERHLVRIEKEREKAFAAFRPHKYRVYIDDVLVQSYRGY
jgi:hypothetical protein